LQGTYRGLLAAGNDFTKLMQEHASVNSTTQDSKVAEEDGKESDGKESELKKENGEEEIGGQGKEGKLMKIEERAKGKVDSTVFKYYVAQIGKMLVLFVISLYVFGNFVRIFRDWFVHLRVHAIS
jgi:hypothetical protein